MLLSKCVVFCIWWFYFNEHIVYRWDGPLFMRTFPNDIFTWFCVAFIKWWWCWCCWSYYYCCWKWKRKRNVQLQKSRCTEMEEPFFCLFALFPLNQYWAHCYTSLSVFFIRSLHLNKRECKITKQMKRKTWTKNWLKLFRILVFFVCALFISQLLESVAVKLSTYCGNVVYNAFNLKIFEFISTSSFWHLLFSLFDLILIFSYIKKRIHGIKLLYRIMFFFLSS